MAGDGDTALKSALDLIERANKADYFRVQKQVLGIAEHMGVKEIQAITVALSDKRLELGIK